MLIMPVKGGTIDMSFKKMMDNAIRACDSKGREVVIYTEKYLREIGKNNSIGKYDKIVQGVRSLLSQSLLSGEELYEAVKKETDRLLKKYNM